MRWDGRKRNKMGWRGVRWDGEERSEVGWRGKE